MYWPQLFGEGLFLAFIVGSVVHIAYCTWRQLTDPGYESPYGESRSEKAERIERGHRYGWINEETMTDEEWRDWQGQRSW